MQNLATPFKSVPQLAFLGRTVVTSGVSHIIQDEKDGHRFVVFVVRSLKRHRNGDWGDVCDEDKKLNDEALETGQRILSAYKHEEFSKIWIITEWDRSVTTVLFPKEY
ncbi:MAG: hypothetical protein Unbinned7913contig1002_55 [Prokaryotic dsDNA virus sp.]|jgi:hypothetical protein|nr:MAG: hypothetical protein Unbinned7913contig1002_55 [Prokaryotic dsDNA virus sp.]|tara:strand:- start:237 stop:560 length:324 start_codon:yes stop_codon:yes gene_type:complete